MLVHLVTALLLVLLFRAPPTWRLEVGGPSDTLFLRGFFPPEQTEETTFRWSSPDAQLTLHGASASPAHLKLRTHSNTAHTARSTSNYLHLATIHREHPFATFEVEQGWRIYHLLLPDNALVGPEMAVGEMAAGMMGMMSAHPLSLHTERYCPDSGDTRVLGVPIDWIEMTPLPSAATGFAALELQALLRALLLTGVLVVFSALVRRRWSTLSPLLTLCSSAVLLLWAWWNPYTLAWAMQPVIAWVPGAVLVLFGVIWALFPRRIALAWSGMRRLCNTIPHPHPRILSLLLVLIAALCHLPLLLPAPVELQGAAALLLLGLPGALLVLRLLRSEIASIFAAIFLALCGGLVWLVIVLLLLQALPGALPTWLPLVVCDSVSIILLWQNIKRSPQQPTPSTFVADRSAFPVARSALLVGVLLLGAVLRMPFLGGAEFQGDEARAMLMAVGVMHGHDDILMLHRKGPVEVLLPAALMVTAEHINEWAARLPFALAGVGIVLGGYLLGERMIASTAGGLLAATILATDGFLIAFSRIVQYQSVLVCMTIGAVWCGWRFYEEADNCSSHTHAHVLSQYYLLGAALLIATGLLAHYDAIFTLPTLAWLVVAGGRRRGWRLAQWVRGLALPVLAGTVLLGSFYLPFVLHDHFAGTIRYMLERSGQGAHTLPLFNNLPGYYERATFYNTTFQINVLAVTLLAGIVVWLVHFIRPRPLGALLAAMLLVASMLLVFQPGVFEVPGGASWAIVPFGLPLAALALAPTTPAALRTLIIWFSAPFLAESFLIGDPRTHFYTMDSAAALLIGLILVQLLQWLEEQQLTWLRIPLALTGLGVVLLAVPYLYLVFLQQSPEYQRTFPAARPDIYRASYGDTVPEGGHFGFPHHDGWKVIGTLYHQGVLMGDYFSNQRERVSGWYTRGAFRCEANPDYYFLATRSGNAAGMHIPVSQIREEYHHMGCILVDGTNRMNIYSQEPGAQPPQVFVPDTFRESFDAQAIASFPIQRSLVETTPQHRLDQAWQQGVLLHGYDLDRQTLTRETTATLVLSWQRTMPPSTAASLEGYEVVVRLVDEDGSVAAYAAPLCHPAPPSEWSLFYASDTAFTITADSSLPAGVYTIEAGLRHRQNQTWLPLVHEDAQLSLARLQVYE